MLLKDKTAVIFGGGGAIGGAVARVFAREGAKVFISGRTQKKLDAVASDITTARGIVDTSIVDVFDTNQVKAYLESVALKSGGIDIGLNAISVPHDQGTLLEDLSLTEFMKPVKGFLESLFITSKALISHMGGSRGGVILTLSTPGSLMAAPGVLGHCVTCAGTEAFSRVLAAELASKNIRVVCLRSHAIEDAPASGSYTNDVFATQTSYKENANGRSVEEWLPQSAMALGTLLKRLPTLSEVSETAAFVSSSRGGAMTGAVVNLTCGAVVD